MIFLLTILIAIILVGIAIALVLWLSGRRTPWPYYGGAIFVALVIALVFFFWIAPVIVEAFEYKIPIPPPPTAISPTSTSTSIPTVMPTAQPTQAMNTPAPTSAATQAPTTTPSPTAVPSPTPMATSATPAVDLMANLQANDPSGIIWDIPADGMYLIKVSGDYWTGDRHRTVVGLIQGDISVRPNPDHYNEPISNETVGNFNAPGNYQEVVTLKKGQLRVVPIDDLGSYTDNTGSVHTELTSYP